jgi:hypothetical protein
MSEREDDDNDDNDEGGRDSHFFIIAHAPANVSFKEEKGKKHTHTQKRNPPKANKQTHTQNDHHPVKNHMPQKINQSISHRMKKGGKRRGKEKREREQDTGTREISQSQCA